MNKFYKKFLGMVLSLLFLMPSPIMANAENSQEINIDSLQKSNVENSQEVNTDSSQKSNALYQKGIEFGAIDPSEVSKENWQEQESSYRENYETAIKQGILKDITYEKWLEENNYGQFPKMDPEIFETIKIPKASRRQKRSPKPYIQSGDILITNSTSSFGILGHAAIANGNEYVLDMPGARNGLSKIDNNRQLTASQWFREYGERDIFVYRIKNTSLARQVGRYADRHYYSTNGSATKNIHINYEISPNLYNMKTAYCSKLVYCAYWYGTGNLPVMVRAPLKIIHPFDLRNYFTSKYWPFSIN